MPALPAAFSPSAIDTASPATIPEASLLSIYALFADISDAMLEAARRGDWEAVSAREGACAQLVEVLEKRSTLRPGNEEERIECMRLVRKVLADDAAIRHLAAPWMRELDQILRPAHRRLPAHSFR